MIETKVVFTDEERTTRYSRRCLINLNPELYWKYIYEEGINHTVIVYYDNSSIIINESFANTVSNLKEHSKNLSMGIN